MTHMNFLVASFAANIVLIFAVFVCIILFFVFLALKKSKKPVVITGAVLMLISVAVNYYVFSHATYYRYNDNYVLGNTLEKIEKRYGPVDEKWNRAGEECAAYKTEADLDQVQNYYIMYFDEDGTVSRIGNSQLPD